MKFRGILSEDAPDPRLPQNEQRKLMPIPVIGFVPQPSLEDTDSLSLQYGQTARGLSDMTVAVSYTLWRNPHDHSDPVNLADLDEQTRKSLDTVPPWPRPAWLIEMSERMRYPQLWEAVRTTWHRDQSELSSLNNVLVDHVNHILMNQYREQCGLSGDSRDFTAPAVTTRTVNNTVTVIVDGTETSAAEIDTDPFVYGIGTRLASGGVMTAVLPRTELDRIQIEFRTRTEPLRNPGRLAPSH